MDGAMNAFAQGYGYESFPTSYAEMFWMVGGVGALVDVS